MPITQVSIFLDNRPGSMSEAMTILDKANIKIFALSIAEAGEFGLVRIVADNPELASKLLEDAEFNLAKSKKNTHVTAVVVTEQNKISKITKILSDNSVNIEYAYSSAVHAQGKTALVLRTNDEEKAEKTLKENNIAILTLDEIKQYFE